MALFWTVLAVALAIVEMATAQMISIWFAGGAVGALIAQLCGANIYVQMIVFIAVSVILLAATRPFVRKFRANQEEQKTNVDGLIGKQAVITTDVNNLSETGALKLNGVDWAARSVDNSVIEKGTVVTVERVEGVKLIVKR